MFSKFLEKIFVKNNENVNDSKVREDYGIFLSVLGVICNIILFVVKIIIGFILNSVAITADSFNNLSDAGSSIVSFIGFKMANKPPDEDHPFGHGRAEYVTALIISFVILILGFEFFKSSITKIFEPEEMKFNIVSIFILFLTVTIKLWLSFFNKRIGKKINSKVLDATAKDSMNDVIITSATILSLLFTKVTGIIIDGYVGIFVSLVLLYSGYLISKDSLSVLLGESTSKELEEKIKNSIEKYDGIIGCHDLIVHNYGANKSMATIHVEVPNNIEVQKSHDVIDKIEKDIKEELGVFLVIHMDPVAVDDYRLDIITQTVIQIISENYEDCSAHEFRLLEKEKQTNLIFDLEVPHNLKKEKSNEIVKVIKKTIQKTNSNYNVIINVENGYVSKKKKST